MRLIVLFILLSSVSFSSSFLWKATQYQGKSLTFQKFYVRHVLKKVGKNYTDFVRNCSDEEFNQHLTFSYFGQLLIETLQKENPEGEELNLREKYLSIVLDELNRIRRFFDTYYQRKHFEPKVFELTWPFAKRYLELMQGLRTGQILRKDFHVQELRLASEVAGLPLDPRTREAIRVFLFLEFQSLERL